MNKSNIKIIDAHTHVQFDQYNEDREDVAARALAQGIGMINAGADLKSSKDAIVLAHKFENGVWATVGIHPTEPKDFDKLSEIEILAQDSKVVGIGECGLDYHTQTNVDLARTDADVKEKQGRLFIQHIELSNKTKKPLVIHCREAFDDVIGLLEVNKNILLAEPGIIHFFTGTIDDAKKLLELNFSFTLGGLITFNRSFDDIIKFIPIEKILAETDAPFVSPKSHRGQRNEPSYIIETISSIASIKNIEENSVRDKILENTKRVFKLK